MKVTSDGKVQASVLCTHAEPEVVLWWVLHVLVLILVLAIVPALVEAPEKVDRIYWDNYFYSVNDRTEPSRIVYYTRICRS